MDTKPDSKMVNFTALMDQLSKEQMGQLSTTLKARIAERRRAMSKITGGAA